MLPLDPIKLAQRQLERDRQRLRRIQGLFHHKIGRMVGSPLAFLRGSAPLFYEVLKLRPQLAKGGGGVGWIAGDLHIENFGAFRVEPVGASSAEVVFDLNDFDEAVIGPWRFDVLRVLTSLLLGTRERAMAGPRAIEACESLLDGYLASAFGKARVGKPPPAVQELVERVGARTRKELLEGRTRLVGKKRRFIRGERYRELPRKLREEARKAFARYVQSLPRELRKNPKEFDVEDLAFRIAGTGSLGYLRIGVVVRGKGSPDGEWLFDMKEEGTPAPAIILGDPGVEAAKRVLTAIRQCLLHPPRMAGATLLGKRSMFVRRLSPQEDKLDFRRIPPEELCGVARHLGGLAGSAHRRGATQAPPRWSKAHRQEVVDHAVILAGIHEAAYLAYCRLSPLPDGRGLE